MHDWYNGKVTLAIAGDDPTGVAEILPAAGEVAMVNGELDVVMTPPPTAVWTKTKIATLTVTPPVALILGHTPVTKTGKNHNSRLSFNGEWGLRFPTHLYRES